MAEVFPRTTPGAQALRSDDAWRLGIPTGPGGVYRWAQIDDYLHLKRAAFKWLAPVRLSLQARCSTQTHAGTWGFGLWNDPFSLSLGVRGTARRLPALPNCAWFFHASPPNHLTFQDDTPGSGMLAGVFSAPPVGLFRLAAAGLTLPLALLDKSAGLPRAALRRLIDESAAQIERDWTAWHAFEVDIRAQGVIFRIDGEVVQQAPVAPYGQMGLVVWIDNQYARFAPGERVRTGTLPAPAERFLEIKSLCIA